MDTKSVYIAARSRGDGTPVWATVGRLKKEATLYEFRYTEGAEKLPSVAPFPGMPDLGEIYYMEDLFPIFSNRLLKERRPEYEKWLSWGNFDPTDSPDAISILATMGGQRATDSLEVFASPVRVNNGDYYNQFFLHGVRHHASMEVLESLEKGTRLNLRREDSNEHDCFAVAVDDQAMHQLGYVPRFLTQDMRYLLDNCPSGMELKVKKVNVDAPSHYLVLCEVTSCWPSEFEPCTGGDFQVIQQSSSVRSVVG